MSDYIDSYKLLANAIVIRAATDWRDACSLMYKAPPGSYDYMRGDYLRKQCETFFHSAWCGKLTKLDGEYILEKLKKENLA